MDASAYLTRHGWSGVGHSLHPSGRGIKKPLILNKKSGLFGVGKKKVDVHADQWWARAFDSGLKDLDLSNPKPAASNPDSRSHHLSDLHLLRSSGGKWAGLFDRFTKGESLQGTLSSTRSTATISSADVPSTTGSDQLPRRKQRKSNRSSHIIDRDASRAEETSKRGMDAPKIPSALETVLASDSTLSKPREMSTEAKATLDGAHSSEATTDQDVPIRRRKTKRSFPLLSEGSSGAQPPADSDLHHSVSAMTSEKKKNRKKKRRKL